MAQRMTSRLDVLSPKTAQSRIHTTVADRQRELLQTLPKDSKLSLALDCWTSPFRQDFMAITAYFVDDNWNYRELLLGFEPLSGKHSGVNLGAVLLKLLQKHEIADRILTVTTDNASNNNTLMESIQDSIECLDLGGDIPIIRVPCLAHVIQLSLNKLLGQMKATPKNEAAELQWSDEQNQSIRSQQKKREIINTLNKV